ncbi:Thymidine kinase [Candidatus Cardinium hertigii]|uniref:Thymidine kinase n=2 Tax=Candidatus Cardinium hertigii TaxID=247481 RepID=A0A2Z3LEX4_9BACT|nr:Thymidine kinase [Candidatus Cardinium hertigii]
MTGCVCQARGSIHLIIGPMFSGKTTELFRLTKRYILAGKKTILVKYAKDKRHNTDMATTHDRVHREAFSTLRIKDVYNSIINYDIIGIDEGQFFPDIVPYAQKLANQGKTLLIAALNGDYLQKPFRPIATLLAQAERIEKLNAVCQLCGHSASFTYRIIARPERELIGGIESYQAVCRLCYRDLYKKKSVIEQENARSAI